MRPRLSLLLSMLIACACVVAASAAEDSPLVAASKHSNRRNAKPKVIITNATLSKHGGHVSTTSLKPLPATPQAKKKALSKKAVEDRGAKPKPVAATTTDAKGRPLPEPLDDVDSYDASELDPEAIRDPVVNANIPASLAAKADLKKPKVATPIMPQLSQAITPQLSRPITPQFTPPQKPQP